MSLINLILLFLYLSSNHVNGQCTDSPVIDSEYLCTSPVTLTPASTGFNKWPAAGIQDMTIAFNAQITDLCSLSASTVVTFMTMRYIQPNNETVNSDPYSITVSGVDRQLFRFVYNPTIPALGVYSEDVSGPYPFLTLTLSAPLAVGDWVEFVAVSYMSTNAMRCGMAASGSPRVGSIYTKTYTDFLIDNSTKFTWCSNFDGSNPFSCVIKNLKLFYNQIPTAKYYMGGIEPQLIGYFKLDEGTGTSLTNSITDSPLGNGYFGNSLLSPTPSTVPTWSTTDIAVKFATPNQFLTLPIFALKPGNQATAFKFTFQLYLKIDTPPASIGQIFAIGAPGGPPKLSVVMDNTLMIGYTVLGSGQLYGPTGALPSFSLATWQQLTVSFQLRANLQTMIFDLAIETVIFTQVVFTLSSPGALTFTTTDQITIGGNSLSFLGEVASLRIMSPGAMPLPFTKGGCSSGSSMDFGITNPSLPSLCSAPYVLMGSQCVECESGYYARPPPQPNACPACVSPCVTCTSETACSSCVPNYSFDILTSTCTSCVPGTYSAGRTVSICTDCPQLCATCTSAQICQTCLPNAFLSSSSCLECPIGTYSLGGSVTSCTDCPPSCATCTSADVCQSCNGNYYLQGSTCLPCPSGTFTNPFNTETSCSVGLGAINPEVPYKIANALSWLICIHSSFSIANGLISNLIHTIRFVNVGYSLELQAVFKSWDTNLISLNIPGNIDDQIVSRDIPVLYTQYGIEPNFLSNFWGQLVIITQLFVIWIILKLLKRFTKAFCSSSKKLDTVMNLLTASICNAFITAMYLGVDEIVFYSVLEMRSVLFGSGWSFASFGASVIFLILGISLLAIHLWILLKCHKIKSQRNLTPTESSAQAEKFLTKFKSLAILFEDFQDSSLPKHGFLLILVSRNILISLMISTGLSSYPLMQSIVLCYSNCLMLAFLVTMNPFENRLPWAVQVYLEVCVLVVNTCVLLYANLDVSNMDEVDYRNQLGAAILVMNLCLNCGSIAFLLYNVLATIYRGVKGWLRIRRKNSRIDVEGVLQQPEQGRQPAEDGEQNLRKRNYLVNTKTLDFSVGSTNRIKQKFPTRIGCEKAIRKKTEEVEVTSPPSKSLAQPNKNKDPEISGSLTILNPDHETPPRSTQRNFRMIEPRPRPMARLRLKTKVSFDEDKEAAPSS